MLEPEGFRVRQSESGVEAFEIIHQNCPYIVITDWVMRGMDGVELCRRLRAETLPHYVYVVLLTAKSQIEDIVLGLSAGADEFLTKPVRRVELFARLQTGVRILELENKLNQLATRDSLTGLLNRRSFLEQAEREWGISTRHGRPLSCVMLDVDFFKKINDTLGHFMGDKVLTHLAGQLERQSRQHDLICRWGGEEFCVLLPETNAQGANAWAERCRAVVAESPIIEGEQKVTVTASFGVAELTANLQRFEQLVAQADNALLGAKRAGRNRVVLLDDRIIERGPAVWLCT